MRWMWLTALLMTACTAWAQGNRAREGDWFAGLRGGYLRVEDVEAGSASGGFTFGYPAHPWFTVEFSIDGTDLNFALDTGWADVAYYDVSRQSYAFQASVLLHPFPGQHVHPYGCAGLGYYTSRYVSPTSSLLLFSLQCTLRSRAFRRNSTPAKPSAEDSGAEKAYLSHLARV